MVEQPHEPVRATVPTDVEAPDKIAYGLTFRQLAILAAVGSLCYLAWRSLHTLLPGPVLLAGLVPLAGVGVAVAVGRRDGLSLDAWLVAAIRTSRAPHRLVPAEEPGVPAPPEWAPDVPSRLPGLLRLPAEAIETNGAVNLGDGCAALVACSSVNVALRTEEEQAALVDAYGRWLNSLSDPVQIVLTARPVDLAARARSLLDAAPGLAHPALENTARDHAAFLTELAESRDPLRRSTTIACRAAGSGRQVMRTAERTARALAGLGVATRVLDGPTTTGALAAALDPYTPPAGEQRCPPDVPITRRMP